MPRLRHRDLAAFSRALATLYADADTRSLSTRILASVRGLFDCDFATFSLIDLRHARFHASALDPLVPDWPGMDVHERHLPSDPAAMYIRRTGKPHAVRMSDFVSLRQYRNLSVYTEVFGRVGCNRRMGFAVKDRSPVSLVATLNRTGRDFSDEERALFDLLRPHLLQANALASAQERRQLLLGETHGSTPVPASRLTAREQEVLSWLKQGKTNWEIGMILGIAEKTAGKHLEHIFAKLHVENRTAAAKTG